MAKKELIEVRREVPYPLDRVNCLACTYLSKDWLGVHSTHGAVQLAAPLLGREKASALASYL